MMHTVRPPAFVEVKTALGALRGLRTLAGVDEFKGIPYAAPPVGPLRWKAPQAPQPWRGVRDALAFGPDFPQAPNPRFRAPRQDEDCLYLNVWRPARAEGGSLPVLVWFHGGGFTGGSGADVRSDGSRLAAQGTVVVSFNYRSGMFGFLAHPALSAESPHGVSGNYGLLDQLAALAWVRDHIAAFGGDPARVTTFGVSAGSASISLLLTAPQAAGLFQQAALHSPGAGRPLATLSQAEQAGALLGGDLDALRNLPAGEVLEKTALLSPKVRGLTTPRVLRPIHDGWLLPRDEGEALKGGHFQSMPLLVGSNADEGSLLTRAWPTDTVAAYEEQVRRNFGSHAAEVFRLYPCAANEAARGAVAAMFADTQFNYGTRLLARCMSAREPRTWRYLFARRRPGQPDGPHHGEEVPYVFGTLPESYPADSWDPDDLALSQAMQGAWVRFAQRSDPNGGGLANWPAYREDEDALLRLDHPIGPAAGWRAAPLDFLDRFYAGLASA